MGRASSDQLIELVAAAHHEIGNYLAAVRFAAELWQEASPGVAPAELPAQSAERAARQAGLFLALLRPLLRRDAADRETLHPEVFVEALCREVAIQSAPVPEPRIDPGASPCPLPRDDLHNALVALCLAFENRDTPTLQIGAPGGGSVMRLRLTLSDTRVESAWEQQEPPRGAALVLQLVAASMKRCGIEFRVLRTDPLELSWDCRESI